MRPEKLGLTYKSIDDLRFWDGDPKEHDQARLQSLIRAHGFVMPFIEDERTGKLVAGRGRQEALRAMHAAGEPPPKRIRVSGDQWLAPVVTGVSFPTDQAAQDYAVTDNRLVELGGWDAKILAAIFAGKDGDLLEVLGWSQRDVTSILDTANPDNSRRGSTPEEQLPGFNAGVVKQIVVYFGAKEYPKIMERIERAQRELKAPGTAQLFTKLLEFYERGGRRK